MIRVLRPQQWCKNLLVFLPIIFSQNLTNAQALLNTIIAFVSLCAVSSSSYVLNDIADRKEDRLNPEKKDRPIAAKRMSVPAAVLLALSVGAAGFLVALLLPVEFLVSVLTLFGLSQLYTVWLKHEAFADIILIATNFVIRAVSGAFAIQVWVSPWLIVGVFFLALFFIIGKRRSELAFLKSKAKRHRKVLAAYTPEIITQLSSLATTSLVLSYTLYVFFGQHQMLFITLPFALYAIFRYEALIAEGSSIARHPHRMFTDTRLMIAIILWVATTIGILYA